LRAGSAESEVRTVTREVEPKKPCGVYELIGGTEADRAEDEKRISIFMKNGMKPSG